MMKAGPVMRGPAFCYREPLGRRPSSSLLHRSGAKKNFRQLRYARIFPGSHIKIPIIAIVVIFSSIFYFYVDCRTIMLQC